MDEWQPAILIKSPHGYYYEESNNAVGKRVFIMETDQNYWDAHYGPKCGGRHFIIHPEDKKRFFNHAKTPRVAVCEHEIQTD